MTWPDIESERTDEEVVEVLKDQRSAHRSRYRDSNRGVTLANGRRKGTVLHRLRRPAAMSGSVVEGVEQAVQRGGPALPVLVDGDEQLDERALG